MKPEVVVVLAKSPVAGRVKTRLQPAFSGAEAAALAAAAIRDTLDAVGDLGPRRTVVAWDGPRVPWLPSSVCVLPQRGTTLDERLEHVFDDVYASEGAPARVLLVGMDTPHLLAADLDVPWGDDDAVLGPSCDGGYWSIGFRRHVPGAIRGVPMSTARTGGDQLVRLERLGLRVGLLPMMRDVDDPEDAAAVAAAAPATRFGRLHRRLVGSPCSPATLFDAALSGVPVEIRVADGKEHAAGFLGAGMLDATPWGRLTEADEVVVSRCEGPVLDIGCGPGRFVEALACAGIPALGVDLSREAVRQTRGRGGFALLRDVHDRVPGEGRWGTVLLADGNIGIGGDPLTLLRRCRAVLRPGAVALVETSPDRGHDIRTTVTLHGPWGRRSHPVPWAVLGSAAVVDLAASAGFVAVEEWNVSGRAFVMLRHAG
ncbi:MAG TPA: DUF2064 domain-containing protein [Lapillicoccus sp.]|jgi:glycosyltransferase A (GT-A) superfamily protein (DUF2064 family)/SAM-dependent methyltransferase|uniref:DUF2064 domain-containing protein n=1 Tax=Lapillicoccus sp. TaxID=1909287 RepID=UPI002F95E78D